MTDNYNFLSHFFSNGKMNSQSFFMLMTTGQPIRHGLHRFRPLRNLA